MFSSWIIHWIVIYLVDSAIHPLNSCIAEQAEKLTEWYFTHFSKANLWKMSTIKLKWKLQALTGGGCFVYWGGGWAGVVFNVCCGCVVLVGPKPGLVWFINLFASMSLSVGVVHCTWQAIGARTWEAVGLNEMRYLGLWRVKDLSKG